MVCHRTYNVVLFPRIGFETAVMYSVNNFHETQEKENKQKLLELTFFFSFFFFFTKTIFCQLYSCLQSNFFIVFRQAGE